MDSAPDAIDEDLMVLAIEHAAMVCGILMGREYVVEAAARLARSELVEGLLAERARSGDDTAQWARHLGYDENVEHAVLVLDLPRAEPASGHASVGALLNRLAPDALVSVRADGAVAIVPSTDGAPAGAVDRAHRVATMCLERLRSRGDTVSRAGVGNAYLSVSDIPRSYSEARSALIASERMGGADNVSLFSALGIHRLLARYPDAAELRSFGMEVLGRLVEEDKAKSMDYLETLSVYFAENKSLASAAQRLHVHPNTVSYRIRRIQAITGLDLDAQQDRLTAEVAVEILLGTKGQR
ncbi:helix-turn-helix domain-containing protein [Rhodococcus sp. T2V]|uniref:PucR family transcriptional regulator n=1 Tax=Rhodococcus sp. T2V TaxID=3034164 RepID=UPI0023E25516|nr:helix-turn-helix domain-containing protein [Rhodococcus sp. T2V]MDF3313665.1 helix-turn-helix domain-containing protein [Rhodococcus sp. T2V]